MDIIGQSFISNQESLNYDLDQDLRKEAIKSVRLTTEFVLLTPFNLNIGKKSKSVRTDRKAYHQWLDSRIKIFNKHTLNTFESQVVKFDEWGMLLEYPYDIAEAKKIDTMIRGHKMIKPYFMTGEGKSENEIEYIIRAQRINHEIKRKRKKGRKQYIATTRLDSDDEISEMYLYNLIKTIYFLQKSAKLVKNTHYLFNMPYGLKKKMAQSLEIIDKKHYFFGDNCFTTLLSPWSSSENIFSFPHDIVPKYIEKIDIITRQPGWAQIVHEGNIINSW